MKRNIYSILLAGAAMLTLPGCSKEAPFDMNPGEGLLNCNALNVDYINGGKPVRSSDSDVNLGEFTVDFVNTATNEVAQSFKYSDLPEIVSLPAGNYRAEASYGTNPIAAFNSPYYLGNSEFGITAGEITEDVEDVECVLSNIRVKIDINDFGLGLVEDDAQVVVRAGNEGELTFDQTTNESAGYFRYITNSNTLTAVFSGTVDGVYIEPTSFLFDNVDSGKSYEISINVNSPDNVEPGFVVIKNDGDKEITINAEITIDDKTKVWDASGEDDPLVEDNMRPVDGSETEEDPDVKGPKIISTAPGLKLGKAYTLVDATTTPVSFKVTSEKGITEFTIVIESDKLTPEELQGVGLAANLDLVNPGTLSEALTGLGFKNGDDVKGKNECTFDISSFVPMMIVLGAGDHKFHLTVSDEDGTTQGTLWLRTK